MNHDNNDDSSQSSDEFAAFNNRASASNTLVKINGANMSTFCEPTKVPFFETIKILNY